MNKNRKIKTLKQQNAFLRKENLKLRNKVPSQEYANKMDLARKHFESINNSLMLLYQEQHRNQLKRRRIYWKYQFAILGVRLKQWCALKLRYHN